MSARYVELDDDIKEVLAAAGRPISTSKVEELLMRRYPGSIPTIDTIAAHLRQLEEAGEITVDRTVRPALWSPA